MSKLYASVTKTDSYLNICSSGGFITTCAGKFIESGGVVYAASLIDKYIIEHIRVDNVIDLEKTAGSKYSLSSLKNVLYPMEEDLRTGKKVLFIGTPCQCAGMKKRFYNYDSLFLIDLVCHGNTSPKYFEAYINYLESVFGEIKQFKFRDKEAYGLSAISSITLLDGRKKLLYSPEYNWYYFYMKQDAYLNSCYSCKYANLNRVGHITVGDFWGIEMIDPTFPSDRGVSAVIVSSSKGEILWNLAKKSLHYKIEDIDKYVPHNAALDHTVEKGKCYETVKDYLRGDCSTDIFKNIYRITVKEKVVGLVKKFIPVVLYKKYIQYKRTIKVIK